MRYLKIWPPIIAVSLGATTTTIAADLTARFVGSAGAISLDLREGEIEINDRTYSLTSCSDEKYYCYESRGAGFAVALPKICPEKPPFSEWNVRDIHTVVVAVFPHTDMVSLTTDGHPNFMYDYDAKRGIVGLEYDPDGKLFGSDHAWLRHSYDELRKYGLKLVSGEPLFACHANGGT